MPELGEMMRDAATAAGSRQVDVQAAMQRGDQLRLRRTVARASSPMLVVLALVLVLPRTFGDDTVKFLPSDTPGAVASPQGDASPEPSEAAPSPAPKGGRARVKDGSVLPIRGGRRHVEVPDARSVAGTGGALEPATGTSPAPGRKTGSVAEAPVDAPADGTQEPPARSGEPDPSYDPPPAEYCDIRWSDTPPGATTTCAYTATHAGGFVARNEIPTPSHPNPNTAPDYWQVEIRRGSQTFRFDNHGTIDCSDDAIRPGDIVTATVSRPANPEDTFSIDLLTGRDRRC